MFIQSQEKKIKERIENTIKEQYRQASEKYKMGLENIKGKLEKSEKIINSEEKKIIDKKVEQIIDKKHKNGRNRNNQRR